MTATQKQKSPEQIAKNETTGKAFALTGLVLLVINTIVALAVGRSQILLTMLPVSIVFVAVGSGLWAQARKARRLP
jgi:hypothetical protein